MKLLAVRRLLRIQRVVIRYRLDDLILELPMLPWWLRLLGATLPWRWLPRRKLELTRGARLRLALQDLGPIFIKFGQILSTRRDLLPDDIANELAWLQDKVPPFPPELAVKRIEEQLGAKIEQVFARFEREPLASASVAQVHAARLKSGEEVVVKVILPNLEPVIRPTSPGCSSSPASPSGSPARRGACTRWKWSATTRRPSSTNSTCSARRPTPRSCDATSKARRCSTCHRSTGTGAGPRCW